MISNQLIDMLIGSTTGCKGDEDIDQKEYHDLVKKFGKIAHPWAKACFIFFIQVSKSKSRKAIGKKIYRDLKFGEKEFFEAYFSHYYDEISVKGTQLDQDWFVQKMSDLIYERKGEEDFILVAQQMYKAGIGEWITANPNFSLSQDMYNRIKQ